MFKKLCASILMLFIIASISFDANAQAKEPYSMWESVMLTPDYTQLKTLQANMSAHNKKYHRKAPYIAQVYNISTGPNAGKIIWQMGPMMLSHNDNRPGKGGHDEDWRDNVMPYIKKMHTVEYWKQDDKLTNIDAISSNGGEWPILFIRYFEVNQDHGYTMKSVFKQASEVAKSLNLPWGLYDNAFIQGDLGRHIATVNFHKNWASLDTPRKWKEEYVKLNGEDSWETFMDTIDDTFTNQWDEIWVYNKAMSGE